MGIVLVIVMLFFGAVLIFANQGINNSIAMLGRNQTFVMGNAAGGNIIGGQRLSIRSPLAFSVVITPNGSIVNIVSPFEMSEDFYADAVNRVIAKKADIGRIKADGVNLGYRIDGNHIAFLDITREVEMFNGLVWTFLWIALPLLLLIFLASLYFAKRSIRPIENAFVKQKEFVADASHELKTPLATISTNADVLLQETQSKWAMHIKAETGRMANLVESLLYLTKIDYEDVPQFTQFDLGEVLSEVLLPLEAVIHEQKVVCQVNCADGVIVQGDKAQIHRLFGILLDNAIKYTAGEINIKIDKNAVITVQNSGEPIPAEKLDNIFDRFYRVDESHQYTGSFGLGLSIAKAIVDRHKGEITCKSDKINGTEFKVALRLAN